LKFQEENLDKTEEVGESHDAKRHYIVRQGSYIRPRGGNFRGDNNSISYVNNEAKAAVQAEAEMRRKVTLKRCASMRFVGRSESGRWT
jgi:hypothetical protein